MNQPQPLNEDLLTRWIDGQLSPAESALVERQIAASPEWQQQKEAASLLGTLLREHLPARQEPSSPDFFNSSIMHEICAAQPVKSSAAPVERVSVFSRWLQALRQPWFAPVASATAVAVAFMVWNHRPAAAARETLAQTYTPDPRVVASSFYSEDAGAIVIDLQNLDDVPDEREIKAFDVASVEQPAAAGQELVLYAASDRARPVLVLSKDARDIPLLTAVH